MSAPGFSMPLHVARATADSILGELLPGLEIAAVAGSVRRGRPEVGDLDLVAVPKMRPAPGTAPTDDPWRFEISKTLLEILSKSDRWELRSRKAKADPQPSIFGPESPLTPNSRQITLHSRKVEGFRAELYLAPRAAFGWIYLLRTGDRHFTHDLVTLAGLGRTPNTGFAFEGGALTRDGERVPTFEERDVFDALGLPFVEPSDRNASALSHLFRPAIAGSM